LVVWKWVARTTSSVVRVAKRHDAVTLLLLTQPLALAFSHAQIARRRPAEHREMAASGKVVPPPLTAAAPSVMMHAVHIQEETRRRKRR